MREVVVVSALRSPIGKGHKGSLKDTRPDDLLGQVMKAVVDQSGVNPADIDDVVIGTATPEAEQGLNVARTAVFLAGLPDTVPALTINRFCSSGLQSLAQGASSIIADVICGGDVNPGTLISEDYLLRLERESFLKLCTNKQTAQRIQHMLKTGKPLRN